MCLSETSAVRNGYEKVQGFSSEFSIDLLTSSSPYINLGSQTEKREATRMQNL